MFTGAISIHFSAPNVGDKSDVYSSVMQYVENNLDYASITGQVTSYDNSGYFLIASNTDYVGMRSAIQQVDLQQMINTLNISAIAIYGLYFVPSYDMWVLKTWIYEFPKDDDIKFRVKINPVKQQNLKYNIVKMKLALDILNLILQLLLGCIKLFCSFKNNEKSLGLYFMTFNLTIFVLLLISNLLYFDNYKGTDIQVGNARFFSEINQKINLSKQLIIICLLLHSYQTFFSLKVNTTSVYILAVIGYQQSWLWPLVLQYVVVITVFSFLVDNIVDDFNLPITEMPTAIFRLIANSNSDFWRKIINGSPVIFILVFIMAIFWIFYIVNNIYFGIQMEIVRICEIAHNDYDDKLQPNVRPLGFTNDLIAIVKQCFTKKEKNEEENEDEPE